MAKKPNPLEKVSGALENAPTWVKQLAAVLFIVVPVVVGLFQLGDVRSDVPQLKAGQARIEARQDRIDERQDRQAERQRQQGRLLRQQAAILTQQHELVRDLGDAIERTAGILSDVHKDFRTIIQNAIAAGLL